MSYETLGWYASIYFWLFFTGIGIPPCPEEAGIIYAAGVAALHEDMHWWLAWPITSAGIVSADIALYWIGRLWGKRLFNYRWVQRIVPPERRQRIEDRFQNHGVKILLMARLLPPLRTGVFITAGAIRYSFVRYVIADAVYAIFGVGLFFMASNRLIALIHYLGHWAVYVVVFVAVVYALYRYYRYLRERELKGGPQPPISVLELPAGGGEQTSAATSPQPAAVRKSSA